MTLLLITEYFPPEIGAAQARLRAYTEEWANSAKVKVLTAVPHYPSGIVHESEPKLGWRIDFKDEIKLVRLGLPSAPSKTSQVHRIIVQAIFGLKAIFAVLFMGPVDVVVTEYPPIFVLPASYLAAIKSRAKWIVHLSDAWVKAAVDLGYLRHPLLIKIAYGLERFFLRRADGFICVSEGSKEHFSDVLKSKTFSMIPNGVDTSLYCPKPELRSSVRERMGWANKCVGIYTGVIGNQQDFDVILNAAANAPENMHFVIVGGGSHSQLLHSAIAERGLRNVQLHQPLPEAELVEIMAGADYGISTLRPLEFCLGVHPVKLWSYMACELPVIATEFGESGALLKSLGLGLLVEPANSEDFLAAVTHLQADRDFAKKQGVSGREYVEQFRSRRTAAIQVLSLIKDLGISSDRHIEEKRS